MSDKDLTPIKHTGTIEYYWVVSRTGKAGTITPKVMVRLKATNGEIVAQITQGAKDKRDARRSVEALAFMFGGDITSLQQTGPGPKPFYMDKPKLQNPPLPDTTNDPALQ